MQRPIMVAWVVKTVPIGSSVCLRYSKPEAVCHSWNWATALQVVPRTVL